jgi:hypothetical protein
MLHLRGGKKIVVPILLLAFLLPGLAYSQNKGNANVNNYNYFNFKRKPYYFGISLGYNSSNFKLFHSEDFIRNDSFRIAESIQGPGFNIGVIGNLKLGQYFDLRAVPTFSFSERNIEYTSAQNGGGEDIETLESVFFEFPFLVRFKSAPYKDKRLFVLAGFKYTYDLANNSRTRQAETLINISPHDYQFEMGFGVQFFLPYFIFSPQIKYSHGLNNVLIYNGELEKTNIIERIVSRAFTISLNFEG